MRNKKRLELILLAIVLCLLSVCIYNEYHTSPTVEFVNGLPVKPTDAAYVNTTDMEYLDRIAKFELRRGEENVNSEFAMVILDDLPAGQTIENYSADLFKAWDIGRDHGGRGILYVLARKPGLLKIETSYELEPLFPDIFLQSYQDTIKQFYKNEQLGDAVSHLIVEMIKRVKDPKYEMALYEARDAVGESLSGGAGISDEGYVVNRIEKNLQDTKDDRYDLIKYEKADSAQEATEKFLDSLKEGISSPQLGILTEGSKYMAMEYRRSSTYQKNRYEEYERSMPYKIYEKDGYAVAKFAKNYARPILLRKDGDGQWFVDETKMWAYIDGLMEEDGLIYRVQAHINPSPWSFALNFAGDKLMYALMTDRPLPLPLSVDIKQLTKKLEAKIKENPNNAQAYFDLADVLFYENYWIKDAIIMVEKGLTLDPNNERYLRRAIMFGSKMPDYTHTAEHFETLLKLHPYNPIPTDYIHEHINLNYKCFKKNGAICSTLVLVTDKK